MWAYSRQMIYDKCQEGPLAKLFEAKQDNELPFYEGFYIFGGQDAKGKILNDIWIAQPDFEKN